MRRRSLLRSMHVTGLMLVALLFVSRSAKADDTFSVGGLPASTPTATIGFTNNGSPTSVNAYIVPFTNTTDTTTGINYGNSFCIDLWHDMSPPTSFQGTIAAATSSPSNPTSSMFPNPVSTGGTFLNQLNYMGYVYTELSSLSDGGAALGAVQLALWYLIDGKDPNFSVSGSSSALMMTDYNGSPGTGGILGLLAGTNETIGGVNLIGFGNAGAGSETSQVIAVDRTYNGGQYANVDQNLVTWTGGLTITSISTPEPSTFAIGALGAVAFIGYGLRRRSKV
jgi:hypothetical protein